MSSTAIDYRSDFGVVNSENPGFFRGREKIKNGQTAAGKSVLQGVRGNYGCGKTRLTRQFQQKVQSLELVEDPATGGLVNELVRLIYAEGFHVDLSTEPLKFVEQHLISSTKTGETEGFLFSDAGSHILQWRVEGDPKARYEGHSRSHKRMFKDLPRFYTSLEAQPGTVDVVPETPVTRLRYLLSRIEDCVVRNEPADEFCREASRLAATSPKVQEALWKVLKDEAHPQIRWLAMDVLAQYEWEKLSQLVVEQIGKWDKVNDRAAVLGAVVTMRQRAVPQELRSKWVKYLRELIRTTTPEARQGKDPLQTELLLQSLLTFGSFAAIEDLPALHDLWGCMSAFPVALAAIQVTQRVVARHANSAEIDLFMEEQREGLRAKLEQLASVRTWAVENGTMLWEVAKLLLTRFGGEALAVAQLGRDYPGFRPKLWRLANETESTLNRLGLTAWLEKQTEIRDELRGVFLSPP